jgi:small GTP-binding protein
MKSRVEGKVVLLGATCVGKTSIVNRALSDSFDNDQHQTIAATYSTKTFSTEFGAITLRIWDTAGQERYRSLAPMYYQNSQVAIIVFSLTSPETLEDSKSWVAELGKYFQRLPHIYLVGNKSDLVEERKVPRDRASDVAGSIEAQYFETSALTGEGIHELFNTVARHLQERSTATREQVVTTVAPAGKGCDC